ncbi:MAG: hypothetical protein E7415_00735 [Ruminococcaceae bacterium]|nr:hypothetical protein [Oscillospiraceae bacterium]
MNKKFIKDIKYSTLFLLFITILGCARWFIKAELEVFFSYAKPIEVGFGIPDNTWSIFGAILEFSASLWLVLYSFISLNEEKKYLSEKVLCGIMAFSTIVALYSLNPGGFEHIFNMLQADRISLFYLICYAVAVIVAMIIINLKISYRYKIIIPAILFLACEILPSIRNVMTYIECMKIDFIYTSYGYLFRILSRVIFYMLIFYYGIKAKKSDEIIKVNTESNSENELRYLMECYYSGRMSREEYQMKRAKIIKKL